MNQRTEAELALLVGGDLDEAARAEWERRAAVCPDTRACRDELRASLDALHACRDRALADEAEREGEIEQSLWPALESRLPRVAAAGPLESLRPWVPAITVAALMLALATVATNPPIDHVAPIPGPLMGTSDGGLHAVQVGVLVPPPPRSSRPVPLDVPDRRRTASLESSPRDHVHGRSRRDTVRPEVVRPGLPLLEGGPFDTQPDRGTFPLPHREQD